MRPSLIALDADDTLWHSESFFRVSYDRFCELLGEWGEAPALEERLLAVERRNLATYGYGAKGFTLSMIETALEITGGNADSGTIGELLAIGRDMLRHPVEPLAGVPEALAALAERAPLVLVTKGDLFHQESKLAASGLGEFFSGVEIVSEKTADTYRRVYARHAAAPDRSVMAGNSVRSDVLPALEAGGWAALVPYPITWEAEHAEAPLGHPRFRELAALRDLVTWVDGMG